MELVGGVISEGIRWLNSQEPGTQGLALLIVGATGASLWAGVRWTLALAFASAKATRESRRLDHVTEAERLVPKNVLTVVEMQGGEAKAVEQVHRSLTALAEWRASIVEMMGEWREEYRITAPERALVVVKRQAGAFLVASQKLEALAAEHETAYEALSNAWLSRMYWHEHRRTADGIVQTSRKALASLASSAERASVQHGALVETVHRSFAGHTPEMDRAVLGFEKASRRLEATAQNFAWLFRAVAKFQREHTGLRGIVRASTRGWR